VLIDGSMADLLHRRLALSTGVTLDVWTAGDAAKPAIIFLHGFPESHYTWHHQLAALSGDYYCVAPDQRGYCQSSKPPLVEDYSADKLTADVFALADALGIETFTIVGHDWGGAIAWSVALSGMTNGRVGRAVIANAPHPLLFQRLLFDDAAQRGSSQYIRAFRDTSNDATILAEGLDAFLTQVTNWNRSPAMSDAHRAIILRDWAEPGAAIAMLNWYRATALTVPQVDGANGGDDKRPAFLNAPFPRLTIPTLVIWAMDDRALSASNLDGLGDLVTDLTVVPVHGCGHFVTWEAPEDVNAAMTEWMQSVLEN
jgi:pimeloyl-ACP methyl ester carboxylesterase